MLGSRKENIDGLNDSVASLAIIRFHTSLWRREMMNYLLWVPQEGRLPYGIPNLICRAESTVAAAQPVDTPQQAMRAPSSGRNWLGVTHGYLRQWHYSNSLP
jgi:hypothetical protein